MTVRKTAVRGFGYQPDQSGGYHFEVKHSAAGDITIVERLSPSASQDASEYRVTPVEKVTLRAHRWNLVRGAVADEFNQRLKQSHMRTGSWAKTATPLAPHFGKELVLLAWAIEDQDPTTIPRMLANWRGLAPEERWWFYTTINASSRKGHAAGHDDRPHGWRAAIRIAFLEEPRDIGLESLRIDAPAPGPSPPAMPAPDPGATQTQGRLFAEPDSQPYRP